MLPNPCLIWIKVAHNTHLTLALIPPKQHEYISLYNNILQSDHARKRNSTSNTIEEGSTKTDSYQESQLPFAIGPKLRSRTVRDCSSGSHP